MSRTLSHFSRLLFPVAIILVFTSPTLAANLQVSALEVLNNGSAQPVAGARVCVGTQNNLAQVGSLVINSTGAVTFNNVPTGEWLVTVSADGFRGQQRTVTITGNFAAAAFSMERCAGGDCGPICGGLGRVLSVEVRQGFVPNMRLDGAKVCVGSPSSAFQYGVAETGPSGESAIFTGIPNDVTIVTVTVSRSNYQSVEETVDLSAVGPNATVSTLISLIKGSGGPVCRAKLLPDPGPILRINRFEINRGMDWTGERRVGLFAIYEGTPSQYQVSESPDFVAAEWQEFHPVNDPANYPFSEYDVDASSLNLNRPGVIDLNDIIRRLPGSVSQVPTSKPRYGNRTLYLRFRSGDTISAAKSDSIELRPKMQEYLVSGSDLITLLKSARDEWGFTFTTRVTDSTISRPCPEDSGTDKIDFDLPGVQMGETYSNPDKIAKKTVEAFFFGGRDLNPYWQLKQMNFIPGANYETGEPTGTSYTVVKQLPIRSPYNMVRWKWTGKMAYLGNSSSLCWIANIKLISIKFEGPEGGEWRDAFRRD